MKQIKTIRSRLDNAKDFDTEVNRALRDGWELKKRRILRPLAQSTDRYTCTILYAELEKELDQ